MQLWIWPELHISQIEILNHLIYTVSANSSESYYTISLSTTV